MSDYYEEAYYHSVFYPYCGQGDCAQEYYIPEYCDQEIATQQYWDQSYGKEAYLQEGCDQEARDTHRQEYCVGQTCNPETHGQEHNDQETYNQKDYVREDYIQRDCDQGCCDFDHERSQHLLDKENVADESCVLTEECHTKLHSKTRGYAVIHGIHGLYPPSERSVEGMYTSLEKANSAARELFMKHYGHYLDDRHKVKTFSACGNRAEWRERANGEIEFRTFSEGGDGWRTLIYVAVRTLN